MASLTDCIRKAGMALSKMDADAIKSLRDELKSDGMKPQDAAIKATILHMTDLKTERKTLVSAVKDSYGLAHDQLTNYNSTSSSMSGMAPEHSTGAVAGVPLDPTNKYNAWSEGGGGKGAIFPKDGMAPMISAEDFKEMVSVNDWLFPEVHDKKERVSFATKDRLGQAKLWTKNEAKPEGVKEGYYKGPGDGKYVSKAEAAEKLQGWKDHAEAQKRPKGMEHYPGRGSNADKLVISLFDKSGNWARPYQDAGYEVITFDIQNGQDIMDFGTEYFSDNFDINDVFLILAACPCTDFASSGNKHFAAKDMDGRTEASKELIFKTMATIEYFRPQLWALENPVGRLESTTGMPPWRMGFHPHNFGEDYTKKTLIWGNFNPELETANTIPTKGSKIFTETGGKSIETKNIRSETPEGFAYSFFNSNNALDMTSEQFLTTKYTNIAPTIREALNQGMSEAQVEAVVSEFWDFDGSEAQGALIDAMEGNVPDQVSLESFAKKGEISDKVIEDATEGYRQEHAYDLNDADMDSYRAGLRGEPQPVPATADIAFELGMMYQDALEHRNQILEGEDAVVEEDEQTDEEYLAELAAEREKSDAELEERQRMLSEAQEWSDFQSDEGVYGQFERNRETDIIVNQQGVKVQANMDEIHEMNAQREAAKQAWRKERYQGELGDIRQLIDPWITALNTHAFSYRLPTTTSKRGDRDSIRKGAGPILKSVGAKISGDPEAQLERLKAMKLGVNMALEKARHGMFITKYTDEVLGNAAFQVHKGRGADVYNTNDATQNREAILKSVYRGIPEYSFDAYVAAEKGEWDDQVEVEEAKPEVKKKRPLKTKKKPKTWGKKNKVFTAKKSDDALALIKSKLGTLNSGVDPELLAAVVVRAGYHIEAGARSFADFAAAMFEDFGTSITPYLRSAYESVRYYPGFDTAGMTDAAESDKVYTQLKEKENAEREPRAEEPDRQDEADEPAGAAEDLSDDGRGGSRQGPAESGQEASGAEEGADTAVDLFGAPVAGERSDNGDGAKGSGSANALAGSPNNIRSRPDSTGGLLAEQESDEAIDKVVEEAPDVTLPAKALTVPVKEADLSQVKLQMPFLTDGQAEDIVFAENRLNKPDGFGVLFTNGTGTGKTFNGLGLIRRLVDRGKSNILIAAPKQTVVDSWVKTGKKFFGLDINTLADKKDGGKGITVTTFANMGDNGAIMSRDWDALILDESHRLMSNQKGVNTAPLEMLRGMTMKRGSGRMRARGKNPDLTAKIDELQKAAKAYSKASAWAAYEEVTKSLDPLLQELAAKTEAENAAITAMADKDKPRSIFLSATPFAYEKNVQWANEYLFDWGKDENGDGLGYNSGVKYEQFMMQHFGYRMRYNKLTEPDAKVDRGIMQRAFNTWLKKEGALSGRMLDSDFDYDRKFVMSESAMGRRVDEALEWLRGDSVEDEELQGGMRQLQELINESFDYHSRMYFLEGMKAREAIPTVQAHLDMGRNVVVMHDYKKGGIDNPFKLNLGPRSDSNGPAQDAYAIFKDEFKDLISSFDTLPSVIDTMSGAFPEAVIYNGDYSAKKRVVMQDNFNDDTNESRLIIAQGDAMQEGVSIHDESGAHQRVLVHLGMPVKPTASIQQEGRIYRTGQGSDAIFRYFTIGTNWERFAFADKIAGRAGAAENLAMGEQARGLKEAFITAYEEADLYPPGHEGEGQGGKEADRAMASALTPWDVAKSYYFGSKQQGKGRGARGREQSEFFATPEPLGLKMVEWADLRGGEHALEPSAGHGAIGRFFPENTTNRAIEFTNELSSKLALHFDGDVQTGDFMDHNLVNKYDAIVMNPPFGSGGKQAAEHVGKAMKHLRNGGRIVALVPEGPAADKQFAKLMESEEAKGIHLAANIKLPRVTFERAGTAVAARVMVLEKQTDPEIAAKMQQTNRDYSEADTIGDFFDRLETSTIPMRQEATFAGRSPAMPTSKYDPKTKPAVAGTGFTTMDSAHSKTGDPLFVVNMSGDMGESYGEINAIAKNNGGFYIRAKMRNWYKPTGGGTIEGKPTFTFKSAGDRAAFLADVSMNGLDKPEGAARAAQPGYLSVDQVQKIADRLTSGKTKLANITVLQSMEEMPEARVIELRQQGLDTISGYYHRPTGEIYLIADGLSSARSVQVTLLHESIGHRGMERMMGDDFDGFLRMVHDAKERDPVVKAMYAEIERNYGDADPGTKAAEVIAFMAEDMPNNSLVRKVIKFIRTVLRKMGFNVMFTNRDIIDALHRAGDQVRSGDYEGAGGEGVAFQAAYHGSPYRHNKFSTQHIGSGEGMQSYGWGLYFAEEKQVAEYYREALASREPTLKKAFEPGITDRVGKAAKAYLKKFGTIQEAVLEAQLAVYETDFDEFDKAPAKRARAVRDVLKRWRDEGAMENPGALYTVEVPEASNMLDYDAKLGDQPAGVQDKLKTAQGILDDRIAFMNDRKQIYTRPVADIVAAWTGEDIYGIISEELGSDRAASMYLTSLGIPALRFFDEQSRGTAPEVPEFDSWAGYYKGVDLDAASPTYLRELRAEYHDFLNQEDTRTRNFVIFDDTQVEITDTVFKAEETTKALEKRLSAVPGVKTLSLYESKGDIHLNTIMVDKDARKAGVGSAVLRQIVEHADTVGKRVTLSVAVKNDLQGTTSRGRLVRLYKRFGFVENKGRNKDFSISDGMYRDPIMVPGSNTAFRAEDQPDMFGAPAAEAGKLSKSEVAEWRVAHKVSQRQGRIPEVKAAAEALSAGELSNAEYTNVVRKYMPIMPIADVPALTTVEEMSGALATNKAENILGVDRTIKEGTRIASRLDIPAYDFYNTWVVTLHDGSVKGGKSVAYGAAAVLDNVEFVSNAKAALGIATGKTAKAPFARIHGDWNDVSPEAARAQAAQAMESNDWVQVGMNPFRHSYFYSKVNGQPVVQAKKVIQVGPLVMAQDPVYGDPSDPEFTVKGTDTQFRSNSGFGGTPKGEKMWDWLVRKWQDKMRPLLLAQADISEQGGDINLDNDAYRAEEAFYGKTENDLEKMKAKFLEPMVASMAESGITQLELDEYLTARHARERNAHIRSLDGGMQDGGSGMTDQESRNVLAAFDATGKTAPLAEAAAYVYDMLQYQRDLKRSLQGDVLTDTWEAKYNHYVPLKGLATDEDQDVRPMTGRGFDIRGKESKRAMGRQSRAESPIMHSIKDTTDAVIRFRKNEVGNVFLKMVRANPDPDYWQIFTDENPDMERRIIRTKAGDKIKMVPRSMHMLKDEYFATKKGDTTYYIKLADKRLIHAMQNMGPEPLNVILRGMNTVTRFLSSMSTSYNPEFMISNAARDIQTAVLNLLAEQDLPGGKAEGVSIAGKMVKSTPRAIRIIHASLYGKQLTGENARWQDYFEDFKSDGAKTGWFDQKDVDGQAKELERLLTKAKGGAAGTTLKSIQLIKDIVEHSNTAVENGVRLSVYVHAREAGIPRKKAASLAKNLTVNFNRKGEIGGALNAVYMFANASVQGTANFARTMATFKADPVTGKRSLNMAQKAGAALVGAAFGLALLNRFMSGDDDDGVNWYDKVPKHVRERNVVLMKSLFGGPEQEYYTIPLPYGYNVFYNLGDSAEAALNSEYRSLGDIATGLTMAVAGSFSPIGFEASERTEVAVLKSISPTVLSPIVQLAANENFYGAPIYRENGPYDVPAPDSALSRRSTKAHLKGIAKWFNNATGGSDYRSGLIDFSPDTLGHLFDFGTGSAGAFYSRAFAAGAKVATGQEMDDREIPFYRKVSGKVMPYEDQSKFYERRDELAQISKEFKSLDSSERDDFRAKYNTQLKLSYPMKASEKKLAGLRKLRKTAEASKSLSDDARQERLDKIQTKMDAVIDAFNLKYSEAQ